jgi:hypothetical protein
LYWRSAPIQRPSGPRFALLSGAREHCASRRCPEGWHLRPLGCRRSAVGFGLSPTQFVEARRMKWFSQNKALVLEAFDTLFNKRDYAPAEHASERRLSRGYAPAPSISPRHGPQLTKSFSRAPAEPTCLSTIALAIGLGLQAAARGPVPCSAGRAANCEDHK